MQFKVFVLLGPCKQTCYALRKSLVALAQHILDCLGQEEINFRTLVLHTRWHTGNCQANMTCTQQVEQRAIQHEASFRIGASN